MRILVVQETDWLDRNPILHHRMLESLALQGHEVTVIDFDILWHQKGRWPLWQPRQEFLDVHRFFLEAPVTVMRPAMLRVAAAARPSWAVANALEMARLFRRARPDVVVAYGISNAYVALRFAHRYEVRFVYHVLDALHTLAEPKALRRVAWAVERSVLRRADAVVVVNNALAHYARQMGAPASRLNVVPSGVEVVEEDRGAAAKVRASLGIAESDILLLFIGWLYTFSGLREVVQALAADRGDPCVKLLVVGHGDLMPELARLRQGLGLEDRLILTGRRPLEEMPHYVASADFCLLPAQRNKTMEHIVPGKVIEYLQGGRALVVTDLSGIRAEFGDLPGILYIDEPDQAIAAVRRALAGAEDARARARELGETCRFFMRRREGWDEVTKRFGELLAGSPLARG